MKKIKTYCVGHFLIFCALFQQLLYCQQNLHLTTLSERFRIWKKKYHESNNRELCLLLGHRKCLSFNYL